MSQMTNPFFKVKDLIAHFVGAGCELRVTSKAEVRNERETVCGVRYLYNPKSGGFIPLSDLEDNERVPQSEVESWERRLGISISAPPGLLH